METVSNALAKSAEGQNTALGKLGVGIDAAALKTMSFDEIQKTLAATFGGQAAIAADTFQGKMDRLKVAFNEGKETVGSFVLNAITPMVTYFVDNVVPVIQSVSTEIGENLKPTFEVLSTYFTETLIPTLQAIWAFINDYIIPILVSVFKPAIEGITSAFGMVTKAVNNNKSTFDTIFVVFKAIAAFVRDYLAPAFGTTLKVAFNVIGDLASGLVTAFSKVVSVINSVVNAIQRLIDLVAENPLVKGIGNVISNVFGGFRAAGGSVTGGTSYLVGERGAELFTPSTSGMITPNNRLGGGNTVINLSVTGAVDSEGTARTIINALNNSFYRGTGGAMALVTS